FKTYQLTREKFQAMIKEDLEVTCTLIQEIVKNAGLTMEDIDKVLLVGGSSRIPYVEENVAKITGKKLNKDADTELIVALGAALYAESLARKERQTDSETPHSTSVETNGEERNKAESADSNNAAGIAAPPILIPVPERYKHFFKKSLYEPAETVAMEIGTSFCRVSCLKDGKPTVIYSTEGQKEFPTAICFSQGQCIFGYNAKAMQYAANTVVFRDINNLARLKRNINIEGTKYPPELLYAFFIQKLKENAESYFKKGISKVLLITPAYLSHAVRKEIKKFAALAEVEVINIIDSCSARAMNYAYNQGGINSNLILCYVSGEYTEASVFSVDKGTVRLNQKLGITLNGGNDFTRAIVNYFTNEFSRLYGIDLSLNREALDRIEAASEKCKADLMNSFASNINIPNIVNTIFGMRNMFLQLTKGDYAQITANINNRIAGMCKLSDPLMKAIGSIILTGEGAVTPLLKERIQTITGLTVSAMQDSGDHGVLGGAVCLGIRDGSLKEFNIVDCSRSSLVVKTCEGGAFMLVPRNTVLPAVGGRVITVNGGIPVPSCLSILEESGSTAVPSEVVASFDPQETGLRDKKLYQLEVHIEIDTFGSMKCTVKNLDNGQIVNKEL
ncbi:MAG: Hsp70 family protein, partial [Bacillota bacterium]|nr:Hsp70 family protein [Bacillota bacterium]